MLKLCALILAFFIYAQSYASGKEEIVYLNLGPTDLDRWMDSILKKEQQELEKSLLELPANKVKWNNVSNSKITYIVKQKLVGVIEQDPCETLPIRVILRNGNLISARYTESGGTCSAGQSVKPILLKGKNLYITPKQLFGRIEDAKEQLKCYLKHHAGYCNRSSLKVNYSEQYGLPLHMEDHDYFTSDYFWSLEVSELEVLN
jgi:hypothetical protein